MWKCPESGHVGNKNSEKMIESQLIYRIGNFSVLFQQDKDDFPNVACIALLFFSVFTLVLNSFLLLTLLFSNLRSNPYNASLATLAAVSVLDGLFNVTSSIIFHASWEELAEQYGEDSVKKWCRTNAMTLQFTGMTQSFVLAVLIYDRQSSLIVRNEENIRKKNKLLKWMLFLSVVVSILMILPIWLEIFTTNFFKNRMSCSPANVRAKPVTVFFAILVTVTYLSTWFFTLHVSFLVIRKVHNNRRRLIDLSLASRQRAAERTSFRDTSNSSPQTWSRVSRKSEEYTLCILTGLLIVSYMLAVWPNIIAVQITQFYKIYDESLDFKYPNHTILSLDFIQIRTDIFDSVFSWTRYGYNVFLPVAVFLLDRELRKKCRITLCCFEKSHGTSVFIKREEEKSLADNTIPVLFASSEGLHLRIINNNSLKDEPSFLVKFCDLLAEDSQGNRNETRETSLVELGGNPVKESKSSKTFVVNSRESFFDTYVKLTNTFDRSNESKHEKPPIELNVIEEYSSHG